MKKINWGVVGFGMIAAVLVVILAWKSTGDTSVQAGPDQAQVAKIQAEMAGQVPKGLPPIPKEQAEAGVSMRGRSRG